MEEELILQQPSDRRLGDNNTLPPGPPGAEFDAVEFERKNVPSKPPIIEKEKSGSERSSRRRSPSGSPPPRKRKSPRNRRSPSPPVRTRGRRSPSPRRSRYRDYSPDRRPRYGGRRSPDRRRSPPRRGGGRDRYRGRGRSSSRSISRSPSPPRRVGATRWSPKKKPSSPPQQQAPPMARQLSQPPPTTNQPPPQYGVMAPPPPQLYGDAYGPPPGYNQYGVPPPQTGFVQPNDAYVALQTQSAGFNTAYPPPGTWGVDTYSQQQWIPPPTQIQQIPPPSQQQQPPPLVVPPNTQQPVPTNVPPPSTAQTATINKHAAVPDEAPGTVEANPQHDAVAQEAENQRDELKKQRTSYLKKTAILKKELKMLKDQRKDLHSGGAPASPTTKGFIDENEKLQNQIQKKLSTIENVIDMLTGIIGEENLDKEEDNLEDDDVLKEAALSSLQKSHGEKGSSQASEISTAQKKKTRSSSSSSSDSSSGSSSSSSSESSSSETEAPDNKEDEDDDSSPERLKKKVIESMKNKDKEVSRAKQDQRGPTKKERFNYVFYDPEMHWCQTCNVFPKTAKDFLNHLHTKNHMDRESIETPWHADMITDQFPAYENAPTKRTPIRGLTFFVPATAWFCKLCNVWMGDLHCASTHLKSQIHANRYNTFLEGNPHYEVNWLADRQIALNEQKSTPLPQQITSVSTTAAERKKIKKDDDKMNKKRKKKSEKKQKKKKKKSNKKRRKESDSSSTSSSESSTSSESDEPKKKKQATAAEVKNNLDNPDPGVSIRLSMRKQENVKNEDSDMAPPPPQLNKIKQSSPMPVPPASGKWMVVQEGLKNKEGDKVSDADDSIIQQWNTVQPVISESEKKLFEQLKGKLKNKSKDDHQSKSSTTARADNEKENRDRDRERDRDRDKEREKSDRDSRNDRDRAGRDRDSTRGRDDRDRRTTRRSRTRSPTRSRSRGRDYRRNVRRSRSRSCGRISPRSWRNNRNRRDRSRSRSIRRRSRSPYDRRRRNTRSRSRSTSRSGTRVEKPVVRPAEFRPRVPEKDKEKEKKTSESKDKKDKAKQKSLSSTSTAANVAGKKLPFIGKMPVFKKQNSGAPGDNEKRPEDQQQTQQQAGAFIYTMDAANAFGRPPAPTAAQIQMAMMEDAYGNAPPFHPDAGMMVDYDDLMPDPVQFVNIMGQAPPPPPPQATEDDKDMLPPGIDMEESEEFVPKPITEGPPPNKGPLPKDLEDALNIIFPGEKKPGDVSDHENGEAGKHKVKGETQIINDEAVMQPEELAKEGIHLVTFEETSQLGLDEASQMSMNEPLVFNRPPSNPTTTNLVTSADMELEDVKSQNNLDLNIDIVPPPPLEIKIPSPLQPVVDTEEKITPPSSPEKLLSKNKNEADTEVIPDIPMPAEANLFEMNNSIDMETFVEEPTKNIHHTELIHSINEIDLADIPQPPPSPTESEKNRRQEELDDLAMLGIDADDMAAQCM